MAVFDRGDIVTVPLDPATGHAQRGTRRALVLTTKEFNKLAATCSSRPSPRVATWPATPALPCR